MKFKINKKIMIPVLILVVGSAVVVGVSAQSKTTTPQEVLNKQAQERSSNNFLSLFNRFFSLRKTATSSAQPTANDTANITNKVEPLSAAAIVTKRDIVSRAISNISGDYLLVKDQNFRINYVPSPDAFLAYLKRPVSTSKSGVENWFKSKGFASQDLCGLGIHFLPDFDNPNSSEDQLFKSLPSGCTKR